MLKIELLGAKEAARVLREMPARMKNALEKALRRAGAEVESEAKRIIYLGRPDHLIGRTGRLRNSITHEVNSTATSVAIGTNVVYAPVHEFGFESDRVVIPPRPYLQPALDKRANSVVGVLEDAVEEILP